MNVAVHANAHRDGWLSVESDSWLAERGYDPIYGARPLRRLMQNEIDDRLATGILAGQIRDGDTVRVDLDAAADALTVSAVAPEQVD